MVKKSKLNNFFDINFEIILIIALIIVAILLICFLNKKYVKNEGFITESFNEHSSPKEIKLYLFYADWCPYSRKFKSEKEGLEQNLRDKLINLKTPYDLDFGTHKLPGAEADSIQAEKFKIKKLPTLVLTDNSDNLIYEDDTIYKKKLEDITNEIIASIKNYNFSATTAATQDSEQPDAAAAAASGVIKI